MCSDGEDATHVAAAAVAVVVGGADVPVVVVVVVVVPVFRLHLFLTKQSVFDSQQKQNDLALLFCFVSEVKA